MLYEIKTLFELFSPIRVAINYTSSLYTFVVVKLVNLKIVENKLAVFFSVFK